MKRELLCFQLLLGDEKGSLLEAAVDALSRGENHPAVFQISPAVFRRLPGSPFCYWPTFRVLRVFERFPKFESEKRMVRCGMGTLDDFRFLRSWWEIAPKVIGNSLQATLDGQGFVPYAKGGSASPFWSPIPMVVNYKCDGREVKSFVEQKVGSASRKIQAQGFYFRAGLSFGRRIRRLSPACLPAGAIFSDGSNAVFFGETSEATLWRYLGFLNTRVVRAMFTMCAPVRKMEVGYLQRMPVPELGTQHAVFEQLAKRGFSAAFSLSSVDERTHGFLVPFPHAIEPETTILTLASKLTETYADILRQLHDVEQDMEAIAEKAFGLSKEDVDSATPPTAATAPHDVVSDDEDSDADDTLASRGSAAFTDSLLSYALGCAHGRWDIRFATGEHPAPGLPDPFEPLPVCPPGMLQNPQGLPVEPGDVPDSYPLRISWSGILVDDESQCEDIERSVREVLRVIWPERADAIEQEACEILGVRSLGEYFRKPAQFFAEHLKRYSKSRRQAPIYWPLSTPSGRYTLWIYYHRLSDQTLYTCVNDFVEPKLKQVAAEIQRFQTAEGRGRKADKEYEELTQLELELKDFRDELLRLAKFWKPNLNDGVQITAAPLWKLFQHRPWQKKLKETWESLEAGEYDWAHLAYSIWPDRVREKCKTDKSLAIAHGLEELYQEPEKPVKKKPVMKKRGKKK